jgi:5-methylcytosine-specific restriction endonuclease McrA
MWEAQTDLYAPGVRCGCGCGRQLVSRKHFPSSGDRDTLDHVWPKAFGGPDSLGNLMLLTRNCNDRKAQARPSTEQIKLLEQINTRLGWPTPHELFI